MMLELIICCFLVFAVAYWVALWTAGRREDVLHFVEAQREADAPVAFSAATSGAVAPPVFPKKPAVVAAPPPPPAQPATPDSLQLLLASIKRELKNAAQI
jgi:hypothetical protein